MSIKIGVALTGGTFMPEVKVEETESSTAFERLQSGYRLAMDMGYDYVEATAGELMALSEEELADLAGKVKSGELAFRYINSFVPMDLKICTEKTSVLKDYASRSIGRAAALGVRGIVVGSGVARKKPEGMSPMEGLKKFADFVDICADIAAKHGLNIVLEPLNRVETNVLNSVAEGADLVHWLDRPNVLLLADAFHMALEGETAEDILNNEDIISHLHISEAPGRVYPGKIGGPYLKELGAALKKDYFTKDITVECGFDDFAVEAAAALKYVREVF